MAQKANSLKEWTLMFFFASDNALSPLLVSQLKGIKDAGFQQDTNVLVHFDPNQPGEPTRIFDVNHKRRADQQALAKGRYKTADRITRIGDGIDPFVRNMGDDAIDPKTFRAFEKSTGKSTGKSTKNGKATADEVDAADALSAFLDFCQENYRARHYVLFLIGHGMIVGNDAFLPDEHPVSSITLKSLNTILRGFSNDVRSDGVFEMLALHSCSMSSIEVAFELKGTANYMMGSQGLSFVGSWPYRQLLKKTFRVIEDIEVAKSKTKGQAKAKHMKVDVPQLVKDLYCLSLYNATDFMLAGYSSDFSLTRLGARDVGQLKAPIQNLVGTLKKALLDRRGKELILLAHWKSQSFWQENYTDLFDFCRCLSDTCANTNRLQKSLKAACKEVMTTVEEVVVDSDHFGSDYQYSHGLSVYFPWSKPVEDEPDGALEKYRRYAFNSGKDSWFNFLETYFKETQRKSRFDESGGRAKLSPEAKEVINTASASFIPGSLSIDKPTASLAGGSDKPTATVGVGCGCASIKNYARETTANGKTPGGKRKPKGFSISEGARKAFE